jgi:uncharacterized protein (TIGR02118 family)
VGALALPGCWPPMAAGDCVRRSSAGQTEPLSSTAREDNLTMIRLSVSYPTTEGATFDHEYYRDKHVPLAVKTWGVEEFEIDRGIDGPNVAAVHFKFESLDALGAAMSNEGTGAVLADVSNYTTIAPVLQTSEIVG